MRKSFEIELSKKERGHFGETLACQYLKARSFEIIRRNWRPGEVGEGFGEIDILARRRNELWVIEVKTRQEIWTSLLSAEQGMRLRSSLKFIRSAYPGYITRFALIWINSRNGKVEFLENPC